MHRGFWLNRYNNACFSVYTSCFLLVESKCRLMGQKVKTLADRVIIYMYSLIYSHHDEPWRREHIKPSVLTFIDGLPGAMSRNTKFIAPGQYSKSAIKSSCRSYLMQYIKRRSRIANIKWQLYHIISLLALHMLTALAKKLILFINRR